MLRSKQNILIAALAIALLLGVIAQVIYLHRMSEIEVLSRFQEEHLDHVHNIARQMHSFFQHQFSLMRSLSFLASLPSSDAKRKRRTIQTHLNQLKNPYVERISVCDMAGHVRYSTDANILSSNLGQRPFFVWAKKEQNREKVLASPLVEAEGEGHEDPTPPSVESPSGGMGPQPLRFLFVMPVYQGGTEGGASQSDGKFAGAISLTINLEEFLITQLGSVSSTREACQLWMMDQAGTLLYQSHHPDMVLRNIFRGDESCNRCHRSIDYVKQILEKKEGTVSYQVEGLPRKLATFASVEMEGHSWKIVMTSDYNVLTAFSRKSLKGHFTVLGIFVFVLISGSVLIYRHSRLRIRAEEEIKHWQEKETLENSLRQSEERYRMLVETMSDGLGVMDENGLWIYANDRLCEMTGYSRDEMIGRPVTEFLDRKDQHIYEEQMTERRKGSFKSYEITGVRKDGQRVFTLVSPQPICDDQGQFQGSFAVITDISGLKRTEETLRESEEQLRSLSFQLLMAQEKERGRISRELHDELGQALAVLKLRLRFLEKHLATDQEKLKEECEQSIQYIDQVIEEVRRLSRDLSPSILEDLGFSSALQWLINNFSKNNNLSITLQKDDVDMDRLFSQDSQIIIYRIFQEAFTNIERHSQASRASVSIKKAEKGIHISVEDNGSGFDITQTLKSEVARQGMGLATMRERAKMLGGSLEIVSEEGKGTRIDVDLPLGKNQEA